MLEIPKNWYNLLSQEINKEYYKNLMKFVENEYSTKTIYPKRENVFKALELCDLDNLKVVIIGQDPYHGENQANGLCFSVNEGVALPPSLKNIFIELKNDVGRELTASGNLSHWAEQGCLLLNAVCSVEAKKAASHQNKGWEIFTDNIIKSISEKKQNIVFLLWGNFAKNKRQLIDFSKHCILDAAHPSPLSASSGFFGCKHFSRTNDFLQRNKINPIKW